MDRNRLEKLLQNFTHKTVASLITIEFTSWLKKWLKKSNYREYIKNEFNFCKLDKKVLPRLLALRVLASPKKFLIQTFLTWLSFVNIVNIVHQRYIGWLLKN